MLHVGQAFFGETLRKIIHIDMDYFYAQVEERDDPTLKNVPVGIGGMMNGRGVLCTSNYIARRYGVRAAMPTLKALKLCPNLVLVSPNMSKYKKISEEIFDIYHQFTKRIQKLSLDEAYLDVTECTKFNNDAVEIAKEIKRRIYGKTGLTASAGVSYNKLLAKIGSDLHKPDGIAILRPHQIEQNIAKFSISKIWGVGKVSEERMNKRSIYTFGDLQKYNKLDLVNMFGDFGASLHGYCRGIDEREVSSGGERKSLSVDRTLSEDVTDEQHLCNLLSESYDEMLRRLKEIEGRLIKTIHVKIRYNDFTSTTIETQSELEFEYFKKLFLKRYAQKKLPVRLIGVGVKFFPTTTQGQMEMPLS